MNLTLLFPNNFSEISLRLSLLLIAIILDYTIGDPPKLYQKIPHPIVFVGKIVSFFEKICNRAPADKITGILSGMIFVLLVLGSMIGIIALCYYFIILPDFIAWGLEIVIIAVFLAGGSLLYYVEKVKHALQEQDILQARLQVKNLVSRQTDIMDERAISSAAIESLSENFSDGFIAPVFYYLLFGLPGLLLYKAINTMDSMVGYQSKTYKYFGKTAARLDDIANFLPARLSCLVFCLVACLPSYSIKNAIIAVRKTAPYHQSMNGGYPEAALAGALSIMIGGERQYKDKITNNHWIGFGRADINATDIKNALSFVKKTIALLGIFIAIFIGILWQKF